MHCETIPEPLPGPRQVVIRVAFCGVCSHDVAVCTGVLRRGIKLPCVPGHEIAGTVVAIGDSVGDVAVGVLRTTAPGLSNDVDFFPGTTCKWGFGHMLTMQAVAGGRSAGSMTWAGLYNTYYWLDPVKRVAAVFMPQVLPFADHRALRLYRHYERGIYAAL